jgi:hypothetical protein
VDASAVAVWTSKIARLLSVMRLPGTRHTTFTLQAIAFDDKEPFHMFWQHLHKPQSRGGPQSLNLEMFQSLRVHLDKRQREMYTAAAHLDVWERIDNLCQTQEGWLAEKSAAQKAGKPHDTPRPPLTFVCEAHSLQVLLSVLASFLGWKLLLEKPNVGHKDVKMVVDELIEDPLGYQSMISNALKLSETDITEALCAKRRVAEVQEHVAGKGRDGETNAGKRSAPTRTRTRSQADSETRRGNTHDRTPSGSRKPANNADRSRPFATVEEVRTWVRSQREKDSAFSQRLGKDMPMGELAAAIVTQARATKCSLNIGYKNAKEVAKEIKDKT